MPFDLQSILAAIGNGTGGGFMQGPPVSGPQGGGLPMGPGAVAAPMPTPTAAPAPPAAGGGGLASLFGMPPGSLGGVGSPTGINGSGIGGPMGLLGAGASMLNASGPGNAGLGSIIGSGIGGLVQGSQLDQAKSLQQQQQAALARIAEQLMRQPSGAQPSAAATSPGAMPGVAPPMPAAGRPTPTIPGATPAPMPASGGMPFGGGGQSANPFIQMMLARRMGRMA